MRRLARLGACGMLGGMLGGCSDRPPRERPRADVPAVQVVVSPDAMPLVAVAVQEPNDTAAVATRLAVGEQATDAIGSATDIDLFAVTIERPRTLRIALATPSDLDLTLALLDAKGELVAASDRGPAGIGEALPNITLGAGQYFIEVREFVKKPVKPKAAAKRATKGKPAPAAPPPEVVSPARTATSQPYALSVTDVAVALEDEREPNDTMATAGLLALAETRRGFIGWRGDVDAWRLGMEGLSADNVLDVQIQGLAGLGLTVEVMSATGERLVARKTSSPGLAMVRGLRLEEGAWLKLSGVPSDPEATYDVQFNARYEASDPDAAALEREPNDVGTMATPLTLDGLVGWLDAGDVDTFAVPAATSPMQVVVIPGDAMDVVLEEVAGGRVIATANVGGLGASERLRLTTSMATTVRLRLHKRRGPVTEAGNESQYQLQLVDAARPEAVDPGAVAAPAPSAMAPAEQPE